MQCSTDGLIWFQSSGESPVATGSIKVSALPFNSLSPTRHALRDTDTLSSYTQGNTISSTKGLSLLNSIQSPSKHLSLQVYLSAHTNIQTVKHLLILHAALLPWRADGALPVLAERAPHGNRRVSVCFRFIPDSLYVLPSFTSASPPDSPAQRQSPTAHRFPS